MSGGIHRHPELQTLDSGGEKGRLYYGQRESYLFCIHLSIAGPKATTDLHAGGIFFCTPYEEIITFYEDGTVEIRRSVIENFRPMDGLEKIERLNNYCNRGQYRLNDRNYIECIFDDFSMIGLPLNEHPGIIAFHSYSKSGGYGVGRAFKLVK